MRDTTYNGWTNYETWLVNLWLTNEQHDAAWLQETARSAVEDAIERGASDVRHAATCDVADEIKSSLEDAMPELAYGLWQDLMQSAFDACNFYEIAQHFVDDVQIDSDERSAA